MAVPLLTLAFSSAFLLLALVSGPTFPANENIVERILKDEAVDRLKQLGKISDNEEYLQRTFLSSASMKVAKLLQEWMEDAGLSTWIDQIGNVHGRSTSITNATAPALLIGSHLDTVIDAGIYDGAMGIICALAAVKALSLQGRLSSFPRPLEVIAFSDEEGVRFQSTFLGSSAVAGTFPLHFLHTTTDGSGKTLQAALRESSFDGTEESLSKLKYDPQSVWSYVEVHIEQGPVLETQGIPLGVVVGIAGQTRLRVVVKGLQGHAGTVPMAMRRDPMPAAAEAIVSIEEICKKPEKYLKGSKEDMEKYASLTSNGGLVCTVGQIASWPGANNVIPGEVVFTADVRAAEDAVRKAVVYRVQDSIQSICNTRGLSCAINIMLEANAVLCSPNLQKKLHKAAESALQNVPLEQRGRNIIRPSVPKLVSGAGHDALPLSQLTEVGMMFVRCAGGVSHSPLESVLDEDVGTASLALLKFLEEEMASSSLPQQPNM